MGLPSARISLPPKEFTGARPARKFSVIDDYAAARKNGSGHALHANSLEHGVVHAHVMRLRADHLIGVRIENHKVGVRAYRNRSFARVQAEKFRGSRGDELHETVRGKLPAVHAAGVNQAQTMFDAGTAIWNLREVVSAHLLLLLEAKRTMVGGDDLQRVARQSLPEFFLVPFFAERRSEHELRAFKARDIHIFQREVKILRARFRIGGQSAVARLAHLFKRVVAGKMDDVDGCAGHLGERDGTGSGFAFGGRWA